MNANGPDSRKPWCPICEAHTDYHLDPSEHSSTYTCNECGSSIMEANGSSAYYNCCVGLSFFFECIGICCLERKDKFRVKLRKWVCSCSHMDSKYHSFASCMV